ncbi:sugar transferase [Hutsoniella sourekii]|uniref:sugar transferase n=1 Tax=Hutsoniella sourekii TaxID=87650 RepID=UPI00047F373E|nr:sugar transferase [Hutsoniella sourekii]
MNLYEKYFKRMIDIVISGVALVILLPLLLVIAILVRTNLGSPIIFSQRRPGKDEQIFRMYKFRSMTDARDEYDNLLPDSERLTSFGRALRSTSLDELPELWNILKGDMSFVGPRPLLESYLPLYNQEQRKRHKVRPGLTGLAQVNGRNATTWADRFRYDVQYVDNLNWQMDIRILLDTIKVVVSKEGVSNDQVATMMPFEGNDNDE